MTVTKIRIRGIFPQSVKMINNDVSKLNVRKVKFTFPNEDANSFVCN